MLKPWLKDVLEEQKRAEQYCLSVLKSGWPKQQPDWPRPSYIPENDAIEYTEHCRAMNQQFRIATKYWNLSDIRIDHTRAALRLCHHDPNSWMADFKIHDVFYLLGEIDQAPGHVIAVHKSGKVMSMVHDSDFQVIPPALF